MSPPAAPSDLQAVAVSQSMIQLTWISNSTSEAGFRIYDARNGAVIADAAAGSSAYSLVGLAPFSDYCVAVYAFNAAGCGSSTCSPIWTYTTGGSVKGSATIANGYVYFGSYDFKLYAFSL